MIIFSQKRHSHLIVSIFRRCFFFSCTRIGNPLVVQEAMKISFFLRSLFCALGVFGCLSGQLKASEMLYHFSFDDGTNKNSVTGAAAGTLSDLVVFEASAGKWGSTTLKKNVGDKLALELTDIKSQGAKVNFSDGFSLSMHIKDINTANWKDYLQIGNDVYNMKFEKKEADQSVAIYTNGILSMNDTGCFITTTEWTHFVLSQSNDVFSLYFNGNKVEIGTIDTSTLGTIDFIRLGGSNDRYCSSYFDDVSFFKGALTDEQMRLLGLYSASDPIHTGGLSSADGDNIYRTNDMSFGASKENMTFSRNFTFDNGVTQDYRLTTADHSLTNTAAYSFTVSSALTDGSSPRKLILTGQDGAEDRTVTITNESNSFTGDVSIQKSTLKVMASGVVQNVDNVSILGVGNKITLQEKGTLNFATGDDVYTYANLLSFAKAESKIIQTRGTHTLSGNIVLDANGRIENTVATVLTLSGEISETTPCTLFLKTLAEENSSIALTGGSVVITAMDISGNVLVQDGILNTGTLSLQGRSVLSVAQATWTVGSGGIKSGSTGGGTIQLHEGARLQASANFEAASNISWDLTDSTSLNINTGAYDVKIMGSVIGGGLSLLKEGSGKLTFGSGLTGLDRMDVSAGGLVFSSATALSSVKTINMASQTSLHMNGLIGNKSQTVNIAGTTALQGAGAYTGSIVMQSYDSRLNVEGDFKAGRITFELGGGNESSGTKNSLVSASTGKATITGTEEGSIHLNFELAYLNTFMDQGGVFQLFSSGLDYQRGAIYNSQKQLISLDESQLATKGVIFWTVSSRSADLRTQEDVADMTEYTPSSSVAYLGASEGTVTIGSNVIYNLSERGSYKITPGKGTLVYQGVLSGDKVLYVLDYASIDENAPHSEGSVVLTNNENTFTGGTDVNGTRLVVDLSQGNNPGLANQAVDGNLNVTALGTGAVIGVGGTHSGATIVLQSYGDQNLEGVSTFTYANKFDLSGGSVLKQSGDNAQILTGEIIFGSGENALVNEGTKALTIKGNITQTTSDILTLKSGSTAGRIVMDGAGTLTATNLQMVGSGIIEVKNGYTMKTWGLTVNEGAVSLSKGGTLSVGQSGLSGSGTLLLNGGTLTSAASWSSDMAVTLGVETGTINTGGANVRLYKGVAGTGGFEKQGTGYLYVYDNALGNAQGTMDVKQGRLVLMGAESQMARGATRSTSEYNLGGDIVISSGKGASLSGMINANGHNITFGDKSNFYMGVGEEDGLTGYIHNAGTISFGTGVRLHLDILDSEWVTEKSYTVFSAENIQNAENLQLTVTDDFAFVNVSLDKATSNQIGLVLSKKTNSPEGSVYEATNAGAISRVVTPLVNGVLDGNSELTGNLYKTMQTVSRMTATEYQTYLNDMSNSASSFYTALSAQVYDMTQHINSVRNRVELINPVMFDDWGKEGIYNVWAGGINRYRDIKSDSQSPGYEMTSWGGELGCAIPFTEHFLMGVGFAYNFTDVEVKDGWGNNESDTYSVDIFARYKKDRLTLTGVLTAGFSNVEFHRNQTVRNEYATANSSTDGNQFLGTFEAAYDLYLNEEKSWILQPLVNLTAGRAKLDGLSETGELKNAGLMIGSQSYNMFSAGIGAKIAYQYKTSLSDSPARVELKAMYVNDMGDVDFDVKGRFIGAPENSFDLSGVSNERSAAIVSAGWITPVSDHGSFFADASCEFRKDQNGVSSTVGFCFQF